MLVVKFIFLISAIGHVITIKSKNPKIQQHELLMRKISETTEMIFIFGMSLFLIYFFFPRRKSFPINTETALLLFAYGIVMFIGALKRYNIPPPYILQKKEDNKKTPVQPTTVCR
jgi:uncharacterized membrane protein YgdD (TMEM256/DUF423 family)